MLLKYLIKDKKEIVSVLVHVALGILSAFSIYIFIIWFYLILLTSLPGILNKATRNHTILILSGYVLCIELLGRMLNAAPYVPYQIGNYFMLAVYSIAIFDYYKSARTHIGFIILLLNLPGFFMISSDDYVSNFFNSSAGIVCAGLAAIYFSRQTYTSSDLFLFLKSSVLPAISILVFVFYKTPSFSELEFSLKANFSTSGGFGSNQVSTILGAAACFLILPFLRKINLFGTYKWLTLLLIGAFLYRGLLTFSRGGVLGCMVAVLLAYLFIVFNDKKNIGRSLLRIMVFGVLGILIFNLTDKVTGGQLSLRYQGETGGTVEGRREKDMKVITSGRNELVEVEWLIFRENMLFGVGPGNGYDARKEYVGRTLASHTEETRLLAEQGTPGLLLAAIFLFYPFFRIAKAKTKEEKYYLIGFFALAIVTSFHSGMRTMLTPLLWGLCCASFSLAEYQSRVILRNRKPKLIDNRLGKSNKTPNLAFQ